MLCREPGVRHMAKSPCLPSVNVKTLGEVWRLCRVPMQKHSTKLPVIFFRAYMSPPIQTSNISEYIHHRQLIYDTYGTFNTNRSHITRIEFMSHKSNIKRSPNKVYKSPSPTRIRRPTDHCDAGECSSGGSLEVAPD